MATTRETIEELEQLKELLLLEKAADLEYHRQRIARLPLAERVQEGYAWFPVEVVKTGYTIGDRAFVIIQRPLPHPPDQFRAGKTVSLFTNQPAVKKADRSGIIQYADRGKMKIILNHSELPDWISLGQIGVNLMFDERTYLEMEKALHQVIKAKNDRVAELRSILLGVQEAQFRDSDHFIPSPKLNDSQNEALQDVLTAYDLTVIHGPPGTGKTTTLVEVVKRLTQTESTVLVTAPSNTAVDLLTERIGEAGLQVVRIGNISRVDETILQHTLDMQISRHPDSKEIKKLKIRVADLRRKAGKFKRKFGGQERRRRGELYREAGELSGWVNQLEERLIEHLLSSAQVITCTLVGANHPVLKKRKFRTVVIDEAAQGLEPATWIPILKAGRVVLTGDPFQLPPTVKSSEAQKKGLEVTLIEKALERQNHARLLRTQYRMNETIMGFSNAHFYGGQLEADVSVAQHAIPGTEEAPVVFIDTAGTGFTEEVQEAYRSRFNQGEFQVLREHLYDLLDRMEVQGVSPLPSIAIISPYREQVLLMQRQCQEDPRLQDVPITIKTIDGFQGQERDVVYISLVRSNEKGEIGFLKDYRRMNVAMTRARKKLVIVGDSATIGNDSFYGDFITYCENKGVYRTAWEFMQS